MHFELALNYSCDHNQTGSDQKANSELKLLKPKFSQFYSNHKTHSDTSSQLENQIYI